jgi:hypothetical protein
MAAVGLVGLSLYQVSISQYDQAVHSFLAAMVAAGLRSAIART